MFFVVAKLWFFSVLQKFLAIFLFPKGGWCQDDAHSWLSKGKGVDRYYLPSPLVLVGQGNLAYVSCPLGLFYKFDRDTCRILYVRFMALMKERCGHRN